MGEDAFTGVIFTYTRTYFSMYSDLIIFLRRKVCVYLSTEKSNHLCSNSQVNMLTRGTHSANRALDQQRHWGVIAKGVHAQVPMEIGRKVPHATCCQQWLPPITGIFEIHVSLISP